MKREHQIVIRHIDPILKAKFKHLCALKNKQMGTWLKKYIRYITQGIELPKGE